MQVVELDIFMNDAIKLQQRLLKEEDLNSQIITELEIIGQLPPKLHDVTNKVKALEMEFKNWDLALYNIKPTYVMEHPYLRHKKLVLPGKRDIMEIPREIRDIGLTEKQEDLDWRKVNDSDSEPSTQLLWMLHMDELLLEAIGHLFHSPFRPAHILKQLRMEFNIFKIDDF